MKKKLLAACSLAVSDLFIEADPLYLFSDGVCDPSIANNIILPIAPSPITYAYLSEASYIDAENESSEWVLQKTNSNQHVLDKLEHAQWKLADFVTRKESGYVGSVWVNDRDKQVVLAHRGSSDITSHNGARSWATDLRSIVRSKPSDFVNHAIEMLNNAAFLSYRAEGFHPSITGHSLGGFLAQTCVAHSYVRGKQFDATYYPGMSAVVFDSPGAADFIDSYIRSNLESEKDRLPKVFNIMNFCVSPTIVSTFGRHYGVIYQFITGEPRSWRSVVMDHRLGDRIRPNLELAEEKREHWTSICLRVAQWPQIELPEGILGIVSDGVEAVTKNVFWLTNAAWKKARGILASDDTSLTVAESALGSSGNAVINYYLASANGQDSSQYERLIKQLMVEKHMLCSDKDTRLRIGSEYLDRTVYQFLKSMEFAHKMISSQDSDLGWWKYLTIIYGDILRIDSLRLIFSESREELVFTPSAQGPNNVFDAVNELQSLLREKGVELFEVYLMKVGDKMSSQVNGLEEKLKAMKEDLIKTNPTIYQAYVAKGEENALVMFSKEDRDFAREIFKQVKPGDTFEAMVAIAKRGSAAVIPTGMSKEDLDYANSFSNSGNQVSRNGIFNDRDQDASKKEVDELGGAPKPLKK
jgi:hypothetical protein